MKGRMHVTMRFLRNSFSRRWCTERVCKALPAPMRVSTVSSPTAAFLQQCCQADRLDHASRLPTGALLYVLKISLYRTSNWFNVLIKRRIVRVQPNGYPARAISPDFRASCAVTSLDFTKPICQISIAYTLVLQEF